MLNSVVNVGGAKTTAVLEMETGYDPDAVDVEVVAVAALIDALGGNLAVVFAF